LKMHNVVDAQTTQTRTMYKQPTLREQEEESRQNELKATLKRQQSLGGRLNVFDHLKRLCQWAVCSVYFWVLVGALTIFEPVLW
jgi:hypothetical protein